MTTAQLVLTLLGVTLLVNLAAHLLRLRRRHHAAVLAWLQTLYPETVDEPSPASRVSRVPLDSELASERHASSSSSAAA